MTISFRCAGASLERGEPLFGTASTVRSFLLVEAPGPWGVDAVRDCRALGGVCDELLLRTHRARVRPLLIRRYGRSEQRGLRVFAAYADASRPWVETTHLDSAAELVDLDLDALGQGWSPGLTPHHESLFCVCTHGRHDTCCAELGRPIAAALTASHPEQTWEVSHVGGDRFAGNIVVLPHGLYYGRVPASHASALAEQHVAGELDLDHLRGRCSYSFEAQAAEVMLRGHLGLTGLAAVRLVAQHDPAAEEPPDVHWVDFAVDVRRLDPASANSGLAAPSGPSGRVGSARPADVPVPAGPPGLPSSDPGGAPGEQAWRVRLRVGRSAPHQLTCRVTREMMTPEYDFVEVVALTP